MSRRSKEHATEEKGRVSQFELSFRNRSRSSWWPTTISRGEKSALRTADSRVPPGRVSTTASTHVAGTCRYKSVRLACMSRYIEQEGPFNNTAEDSSHPPRLGCPDTRMTADIFAMHSVAMFADDDDDDERHVVVAGGFNDT